MTLDKLGNPYTPMSEAEQRVMRARPYPPEFTRGSADLHRYQEKHKNDAPIQHRATETRREDAEPALAKAIGHKMKVRRGK